jgi:hypothetical protein
MSFAVADSGAIFVAQTKAIRLVSQGVVTTLAGDQEVTGVYRDGPGSVARFQSIHDISLDADGSLLIADLRHVRRLKDGIVSTVAGKATCTPGSPLDDGPADQICLLEPDGLLVEDSGVYFGDSNRLRQLKNGAVVTLGGHYGDSQTIDGPLDAAGFIAIRSLQTQGSTRFFVDSHTKNQIRSLALGQVKTLTNPASAGVNGLRDGPLAQALFNLTMAVSPDAQGNLYVADGANCRLRHIRFR